MTSVESILIKAVRDLVDKGADLDGLTSVYEPLLQHEGGTFWGAEEMLLRSLLKSMKAPEAELVRRHPLTWRTLGVTFSRISPFSLAKCLADRRFVKILRKTLNEIAPPEQDDSTIKGSRGCAQGAPSMNFQKQSTDCLRSAEAVFEALGVLFAQCQSDSSRMGSEHIKSLFYSADSRDMEDVLKCLLDICLLALDGAETYDNQASWVSALTTIWDLHVHHDDRAWEVMTTLALPGATMLGRLAGVWGGEVAACVDSTIRERWARDLRRFLNRKLMFPSRTAFLHDKTITKSQKIIVQASATAAPAFFDLVIKTPLAVSGLSMKQDNRKWMQEVFDIIESTLQSLPFAQRNRAMETILDMAAMHNVPLSLESLRSVCTTYKIFFRLVKLNPDVFLIGQEGKDLLTMALDTIGAEGPSTAIEFVVQLLDGYAKARDLTAFLRLWFEKLQKNQSHPWTESQLIATVARRVQGSLNAGQLLDILGWLEEFTKPDDAAAAMLIMEAIATGLTQEQIIDAVKPKLTALILKRFSNTTADWVLVAGWRILERLFSWSTWKEFCDIWPSISGDLLATLRKAPVARNSTFAAFKCSVAACYSTHPGQDLRHQNPDGDFETQAVAAVLSLMKRMAESAAEDELYISWIMQNRPRLFNLSHGSGIDCSHAILTFLTSAYDAADDGFTAAWTGRQFSQPFHEIVRDVFSRDLTRLVVDRAIGALSSLSGSDRRGHAKALIHLLLQTSVEVLSYAQLQSVAYCIALDTTCYPRQTEKALFTNADDLKMVLALLVWLLQRPIIDKTVAFGYLRSLADKITVLTNPRLEEGGVAVESCELLKLLEKAATLTVLNAVKQKQRDYLAEAVSEAAQWTTEDLKTPAHLVLFKSLVTTLAPPAKIAGLDSGALSKAKELLLSAGWSTVARTIEMMQQSDFANKDKNRAWYLLCLSTALEVISAVPEDLKPDEWRDAAANWVDVSDKLVRHGLRAGLDLRVCLVKYFPGSLMSPLDLRHTLVGVVHHLDAGTLPIDKTAVLRYVDTVLESMDEDAKMSCLEQLLSMPREDGHAGSCQLFANHRLLAHMKPSSTKEPTQNNFDLATAHSRLGPEWLALFESQPFRADEFILIAETLHMLLDAKAAAMVQWNIEDTLANVATASAIFTTGVIKKTSGKHTDSPTQTSATITPKIYGWLIRLVDTILKRHRRRLHGRFPLLVTTLQSLLRCLVSNPPLWKPHSPRFARLLSLVCEPSVASVASSNSKRHTHHPPITSSVFDDKTHHTPQSQQPLDSDRDKARRYAGQYMYLVLLDYVKSLVEHHVPREMREAMEPGIFSVLDITTPVGLKIMGQCMDADGRAVMRDVYGRYKKFGKWSGV